MQRSIIFTILFALLFISCSRRNDHEVQYSPDGRDSIVYVHYRDADGNASNFWMNYILFQSLFNQGGYQQVYHYYQNNPSPNYSTQTYRNYSSRPRSESGNSYVPSGSRGYSSPSYNSPSRSSGSSYSSPSRGYSTPSSRSFSSPSRGSGSPSRGSSSPSRR